VTRIDADHIEGKAESIQVGQILSLEKRQFSRARTLILIGCVAIVVGGVIAAAHTAPAFAL